MKKIFKAIIGVALVCTVATLTGCGLVFDPKNPKIQIPSLKGLKTTFNDGTYALDDTFELYSKHMLTEIYANFAMPSTLEHTSKLATHPTSLSPQNYDRIRVQVDNTQTVQNIGWKWSFSRTLLGCESVYDYDSIVNNYSSTTIQDKYYNEWTSLYTIPLEIVAIQIAMGQTPQVFTVYINDQTTTIYTDSSKNKKVDEDYLSEIKEQFKNQGTYVGFTEENVAVFKNYFLTEIVGNDVVGTQYDKILMNDGEKTYSAVFDKILLLDVGLEKNFYTPYPASFVKDVTDASHFAGKEHYVLDHVTAKEYQTVTILPNKDTHIWGFYLALEADYDLNLDIKVNFYNNKTQSTENYFDKTIKIKAGKFEAKNWFMVSFNKRLAISEFKNSAVEATTQTQISNTNKNSKYYTYSPSGTYLEGALLECDCLTISFCPQKTQNEYCPFKWVIDLEMEA